MATPPTYDELVRAGQAAANKAGVKFVILSGAKDRCRCCSGAHNPTGPKIRAWGPYVGVIRHITAGGLGSRSMETYIWNILVNDPSVPFKSQFAIEPGNGNIWLVGTGRANHCLNMSQAAFNALGNDGMSLSEFCQNLRGSAIVGSVHTIGIEQVAAVAPDAAQVRATDALIGELTKGLRSWTGRDFAGHGEVASDRGPGDPNEHMGNARTRVMSGTATPPPDQGDDVGHVDSMAEAVYERIAWWVIWNYHAPYVDPVSGQVAPPGHETQPLGNVMSWGENWDRRFAQEGADKVIKAMLAALGPDALKSAIQAAIADSGLDVDEAELARQIITQLAQGPAGAPMPVDRALERRQTATFDAAVAEAPHGHDPVEGDDVPPRTSEAESDAYEGNDVSPEDQQPESREIKA